MVEDYNRVNWKNGASGATPMGATNLNIMDAGIKANNDAIKELDDVKADKGDISGLATKTELEAKADKTELSAYMPKGGGIFTGNLEGADGDMSYWNIDTDGTAGFEKVGARQGFIGNLEGTSDKSKCLAQADTRNDSLTPLEYMQKGVGTYSEFKNGGYAGIEGYANVETVVPWSDASGGYPIQFANGNNKFLRRYGTSDTEWSAWEEVGSGGGGSAEWTGTKAEYEADKDNIPEGMIVNITDDYVEPITCNPTVYSDEESVVGTWFGKPLYRKVVMTTTPNAIKSFKQIVNLPSECVIRKYDAIFRMADGSAFPINYHYSGTQWSIAKIVGSTIQQDIEYDSWKNLPCEVTVEYTKTTD